MRYVLPPLFLFFLFGATFVVKERRGQGVEQTPAFAAPAPSWTVDVLHGVGNAQPNAGTVAYLEAWHRAEGGSASFNWLNTTQGATGATDYNSVGVKNYPDYQTGVRATVETLQNGFYPRTLAGLRANQPTVDDQEMNTWGTGGGAIRAQLGQQPAQARPVVLDSFGSSLPLDSDLQTRTQQIYDLDVARWGSGAKLPFDAVYMDNEACELRGMTDVNDGRRNSEVFTCDSISSDRALVIMSHEMGHMLLFDYYGHEAETAVDTILAEGTATWIAGDTWKVDYQHVSAPLPLSNGWHNTDEQNTIYAEWASFVDFLIATYGRAAFDKLYASGHDVSTGRADYAGVLGKDIATLESDWRAAMAGGAQGAKSNVTPTMEVGAHFDTRDCGSWGFQVNCQHWGTDYLAPEGTPVLAPFDMTVIALGEYPPGPTMGQYVQGTLPDGYVLYLGHLEGRQPMIVGDTLPAGTLLGFTNSLAHTHAQLAPPGDVGACAQDGSCVDFEVYWETH